MRSPSWRTNPWPRPSLKLVDLGQMIPPSLYQVVAEILAYVYRLKNKGSKESMKLFSGVKTIPERAPWRLIP